MTDISKTLADLRHLSWCERTNTSGTSGAFLKSRQGIGSSAVYYKLSCYDAYRGIYGHESVNELIASRLMKLLDIDCSNITLQHAKVHNLDHYDELVLFASGSGRSSQDDFMVREVELQ